MIDELHRCASVGVGQATVGSLQIGCPPIYNYGSQELQDRVLPDIFSGRKRLCLAITEPQASCGHPKSDLHSYGVSPLRRAVMSKIFPHLPNLTLLARSKGFCRITSAINSRLRDCVLSAIL